jgi:DNA polymerase III subunit delta
MLDFEPRTNPMPTTETTKKNIYLFHGPDNYSASQKLALWKKEFVKKFGDLNIQIFAGKDLNAGAFNEAVSTLPFLADKRLVVIEDFLRDGDEEEQKLLAERLEEVPDHCVVVFIERNKADARISLYKRISKIGHSTPFNDRDPSELVEWVKAESAKKGLRLGHREANILAEHVGPDLWQMSQEIEKLSLYGIDRPVDEKAIEELTSQNVTSNIFKLTDYLAQKDGRMSLRTLNALLQSGEQLMQIFFMIVRHFRILIQIKACLEKKLDKGKIAAVTGLHPFAIQKALPSAKNFTDERLALIYRALLQVDIDCKSSRIKMTTADQTELRLSLERLIVELCV